MTISQFEIMQRKIRDAKAEYILYCRKNKMTFREIGKKIDLTGMRSHKILQEYFKDQLKGNKS